MGKNAGALMKTLGFLAVIGMAGLMTLKADAKRCRRLSRRIVALSPTNWGSATYC